VKGYSSALSNIDMGLKINLLWAKEKAEKRVIFERTPWGYAFRLFKANAIIITTAVSICIISFLFGIYRTLPLKKDIKNIVNMRPVVSTVSGELGYEELAAVNSNYKKKIENMDNLVRKHLYLTPLLDALPRLTPKGLWLVNFSFKKTGQKLELALEGMVYLGDTDKELDLVNTFLLRLKENPTFAQYFKEIFIVSTGTSQIKKVIVTNFTISCQG
jgi:hypothetical protein